MDELIVFHYTERGTILNRLDPRFKILFMVFLSASVFRASFEGLALLSGFLIWLLLLSKIPVIRIIRELRYFLILLTVMVLSRTFFSADLEPVSGIPLSVSFFSALKAGWKWLLIIILGVLITETTPISGFRSALVWFLKPLPFVPAHLVATSFSLTISLIPLIFDKTRSAIEASKARGAENIKNPLKRTRSFLLPAVTNTFRRADTLALAMESRCYSGRRTERELKAKKSDGVALFLVALVCTLVFLLPYRV